MIHLPGLDEACRALAEGQPVVLPSATPAAYIVVATVPRAVNAIKGRPLDQGVGITLSDDADWATLEPSLDLPADALARMHFLLRSELLSFLLPLRAGAAVPAWVEPAVRDGRLGLFAGRWAPLTRIWERFPRLFGSSANRTGAPPARSAVEARAAFGDATVIVDGDALRDPRGTLGATTIVRVAPGGALSLHRHGAHDAASGLDAGAFVRRLASF